MENQGEPSLSAQVEALSVGERAAEAATRTPIWYWLGLGIMGGIGVGGVASGSALLCSIAALIMLVGGRVQARVLARQRGIRIGRVFGGAGNWAVLPWFAGLVLLAVAGRLLNGWAGSAWPGVIVALVAVPLTVCAGRLYDRVRLQRRGESVR